MRILIIGSGGREHAIARACAQRAPTSTLFIAPGNPGTAQVGTNVDLDTSDLGACVAFAQEQDIDLTVVGPEQPLVAGLVDRFEEAGLPIVGPSAAAARLEGSKAFAKDFMQRHGIPTADYHTFAADEYDAASAYLDREGAPVVVKASGLAAGKGALVCETEAEAHDALDRILQDRDFGAAGDKVVIEEFMTGEEASVFALADGTDYVLLAPSQDHKPIGEGGTGPNTGGMGAYAPAPVVTEDLLAEVQRTIIEPTLDGAAADGMPYRGVLYCGLMITDTGPRVVEYNCRLGDPEAQVVLPLLSSDPVELFQRLATELDGYRVTHTEGVAVCVVLASGGYPIEYATGFPISGISEAEALDGVSVIHAGTRRTDEGTLVTDGGRVLNVVATGPDLETALARAYDGVDCIHFEGMTFRSDIGQKGLAHISNPG